MWDNFARGQCCSWLSRSQKKTRAPQEVHCIFTEFSRSCGLQIKLEYRCVKGFLRRGEDLGAQGTSDTELTPSENSRHFASPPLVSLWNDVLKTRADITYWWCKTTQIFVGWSTFSTSQNHYPDLGSDASSVWNFCACFSDVI